MNKFESKYTGEFLPFKTISNVTVDNGIVNELPDECKKEDFEPISHAVARFMRSADLQQVVNDEYAYTSDNLPDINIDNAFDVADDSEDLLDNQVDLEDYLSSQANVSAAVSKAVETNENDEHTLVSEEAERGTQAQETAKPSED